MKSNVYLPQVLRSFQGFQVLDIKEWNSHKRMEIVLEHDPDFQPRCGRCGGALGKYHDRHPLRVKHMRIMDWQTELRFWRHRHWCPHCRKKRSEAIEWLSSSSPHISEELAWWINRLSEISTVYQVSRLESLDKKTCYRVDRDILRRLVQGYRIPPVRQIAVDEVYARSPQQQEEGETRNDLFLTVITDLKTHRVIWVSQGRESQALEEFFVLLGHEASQRIEVVAMDQHAAYARSVETHCPQAKLVWDRFHLVQKMNEALNEDRKEEYERLKAHKDEAQKYLQGRHRFRFLTKANRRSQKDQRFIEKVSRENQKLMQLELIKEHFHKVFEAVTQTEAKQLMRECLEWARGAGAKWSYECLALLWNASTFWNYFDLKVTTGVSEGINRGIKTLKWLAYGYKDMFYFALKIMQRHGYLNSRFHLRQTP